MPRLTDDKQGEYIERIRAIIVRRPDISVRQLKKVLEDHPKEPLAIDEHYLGKLVRKIRKDRAQRLSHYTIHVILGEFEQEAKELKKQFWAIAGNPLADDKVKVAALKELRNTSVALFDKMFDAGLFQKDLGKSEVQHTLSAESEAMIQKAMNYGYGDRDKKDSGKPSTEDSTS